MLTMGDREVEVAVNIFQHFSSSCILTDHIYHSLSSDATVLLLLELQAIGEQIHSEFYDIISYHSNSTAR